MNSLVRRARSAAGYAAAPVMAGVYLLRERERLTSVMAEQLDPVAAGAALGYVAVEIVDATLEARKSRLPDGAQRFMGRVAGTAAGALGGIWAGNGNRPISDGISGGAAGAAVAEVTIRTAPYWGHQAQERADEARH